MEPTTIEASATDIESRVLAREDDINERMQGWVEQGVSDCRQGISEAVDQFNVWYGQQPRGTETAQLWSDVGNGMLTVTLAAAGLVAGPFGLAVAAAVAIGSALINAASGPLRTELVRAAGVAQAARADQIRTAIVAFSANIDQEFDGFGPRLKRENEDVWWEIAMRIEQNLDLAEAREMLFTQGVPRRNLPYGEQYLRQMIHKYITWRARRSLSGTVRRPEEEVDIDEARYEREAEQAARTAFGH